MPRSPFFPNGQRDVLPLPASLPPAFSTREESRGRVGTRRGTDGHPIGRWESVLAFRAWMEEEEAVGSVDEGSFVVSVFISAEQGMDRARLTESET